MGLWQQVRWKMQLVIKHWVVHKAGSAQDRCRSHGTTRRLERVALFWASWSFACSAEIDWWLQVWGFPLPRMQSRKEVSANGLKTGNSITGADSMVESFAFFLMHVATHMRDCASGRLVVLLPSSPRLIVTQKTTLLGRKKDLAAIETRHFLWNYRRNAGLNWWVEANERYSRCWAVKVKK